VTRGIRKKKAEKGGVTAKKTVSAARTVQEKELVSEGVPEPKEVAANEG